MSRTERFASWASRPRLLTGAAAFRLVAGATMLYQYLSNYAQRAVLFGPDALMPLDMMTERGLWSLYTLSTRPWYFELIFHLGLLVGALWTAGFGGPLLTCLQYLFWMSIRNRFPELWDGGDNTIELLLLYGLAANFRGRFAVRPQAVMTRSRSVLHNAAMLCFALQLSVIYVTAGLTKVHGNTWWNGTALYYALSDSEFVFPGVSQALYANGYLVALMTYATVTFQIGFPFMLFLNRYSRLLVVGIGITFHLSIAIVLGLVSFGGFLIAAELSMIDDDEYDWLSRKRAALVRRLKRQHELAPT
ncbi:MAG: hypothetical protein RL385_2390 [Pseudomonadota bacterium]